MTEPETDPPRGDPGEAADLEIMEVALELAEAGEEPDLPSLMSRFPGREAEVRESLAALTEYRSRLQNFKRRTRRPTDGRLPFGARLGPFTIVGVLGSGAMGVVYRARTGESDALQVALKVLPAELMQADPRFVDRFRREARLASRVHSPYLAEVYESGEEDGQAFFSMRLIEGRSLHEVLAEHARRHRLGEEVFGPEHTRRAVEIARDIGRALAQVHAAGLVHRDVKPSNILLEREGDPDAASWDGIPILVDFGLLRAAGPSDLTGSRTLLGTPAYAAPEAQLGWRIDERSDTYSLGVVLRDLLTLEQPQTRPPASVGLPDARTINPHVDARLAAILRMALDRNADLRYPNGTALAEELERYLREDRLTALPSHVGRVRLWVRRHPERVATWTQRLFTVAIALTLLWLGIAAYDTHDLATRALAFEGEGDLRSAASSYRELRGHRNLGVLLPMPSRARERATEYWDLAVPTIPGVQTLWDRLQASGNQLESAHEDLLRLLCTPDIGIETETWEEAVFRFWTRELRMESPLPHRLKATRACANYFLVRPLGTGKVRPDRRKGSPTSEALERELRRIAGDPTEDLVARQYATSTLGGMSFDSFPDLVELIRNDDPVLRRVAIAGAKRLWYQKRHERFLEGKGPLVREDLVHLESWAEEAWNSLARVAARWGEEISTLGDYAIDRYFLTACAEAVTLFAWHQIEWERAGHEIPTTGVTSLDDRLTTTRDQLHHTTKRDFGPQDKEVLAGWPETFQLNESLLKSVNRAYYSSDSVRTEVDPSSRLFTYTNTWDMSRRPLKDGKRNGEFEATDRFAALHFSDGPVFEGTMTEVQWHGGSLIPRSTRFFLELDLPHSGSVTFEAAVPDTATSATLEITHSAPRRIPLPNHGNSKVEIQIVGEEYWVIRGITPKTEILEVPIPDTCLRPGERMRFQIRMVDSTSLYWLEAAHVRFELP